ncbi:MAG: prolyl oligopeptidase family serine peptidase [archaeon]
MITAATSPAVADELRDADRSVMTTPADLTPIEDSYTPTTWYTIGPFQYQRREAPVDWLYPSGGADDFVTGEAVPTVGESLPSAFAGGASVEWTEANASGNTVSFPQAGEEIDPTGGDLTALFGSGGLFDDFQDWFGIGSVQYGIGYAFTTFEMSETRRAVLESNSTVWLNGRKYEESPAGVVLQEGTNYLLAQTTLILGTSGAVSLSFRPPEAPVEVNDLDAFRGTPQNVIVPDLKVGEDDTDLPASVRVTNTTGEQVENATLTFAPDDAADGDLLVTQEESIEPPLAPFETRRINTRVQLPGATATGEDGDGNGDDGDGSNGGDGGNGNGGNGDGGGNGGTSPSEKAAERAETRTERTQAPSHAMADAQLAERTRRADAEADLAEALGSSQVTIELSAGTITVRATVAVGDETHGTDVPIRVRGADESRRQSTFTSRHDESVQTFAYRTPANHDSGSAPWNLIVSLHGANVPPINQAGANVDRDDTFVVAPAARGPVNYDHEDLGRLDDLEAMGVMMDRYDIDPSRVFLSGHSMGGHGTWHVGLTNPKHFAAIGPSAGWTDHETYITVVWSRDKLHAYPGLKAVKEKALQKNLAMPKTHNAADGTLPAFVLHGGQDTSVPTMQPRSYVRELANRGLAVDGEVGDRFPDPDPDRVDVAFLEVPGAGHWWDKGIGPGNDGVNHPDMWEFLLANTRDPYPEELVFYTTNLRVENQKHWVTVLEQETVHEPTIVEARVTDDGLDVRTTNVAKLRVDTRVLDETSTGASGISVDGESRGLGSHRGKKVNVDLQGGLSLDGGPPAQRKRVKGADQYGPMQEVHHDPYRLVYGTAGSEEETAINRNLANLRSQRLVTRARAPATVIPDTAVTRDVERNYNLVLFGRPSSNEVLDRYQSAFPIRVGDGEVRIGNQTYTGDLGVEYVYPNPRAADNLVQVETGTTLDGLQLTRTRNWIPTQTATADYQIYDESIRYQKWNANLAAGFFDKHWKLSDDLGVIRDVDERRQ